MEPARVILGGPGGAAYRSIRGCRKRGGEMGSTGTHSQSVAPRWCVAPSLFVPSSLCTRSHSPPPAMCTCTHSPPPAVCTRTYSPPASHTLADVWPLVYPRRWSELPCTIRRRRCHTCRQGLTLVHFSAKTCTYCVKGWVQCVSVTIKAQAKVRSGRV
jgi:hypothetical protein